MKDSGYDEEGIIWNDSEDEENQKPAEVEM
jgi:hypothetical protein